MRPLTDFERDELLKVKRARAALSEAIDNARLKCPNFETEMTLAADHANSAGLWAFRALTNYGKYTQGEPDEN